MDNILKINRCLISVSDKTNIIKFAKSINKKNIEIFSTGNTYKLLNEKNIKVKKVESLTNFPEVLDGRVKTLHPKIFGGILGDPKNVRHEKDMKKYSFKKFDLVVVNLYPFEETIKQTNNKNKCIENIDVGGPSMIRAAAKNHENTAIIVEILDYEKILHELDEFGGLSLKTRSELAIKAFAKTARYDLKIFSWMTENFSNSLPKNIFCQGNLISKLRYGENPHQKASIYANLESDKLFYEQCNGKELSYNNLNDLKLGLKVIAEFSLPASVIIKHAIPSSVSESKNINLSWRNAYNADSLSAFGGVVIFNREVNEKLALELTNIFLEVIVAPSFSKKALKIFSSKSNLRIIKIKNITKILNKFKYDITLLPESLLVQEIDDTRITASKLKVVTEKKPSNREVDDLLFANKVVKHVRSNAIVIAKNKTTLGIGSGNTSRVDSVQFAIIKAQRSFNGKKEKLKGAVLASDAFFPFSDSIQLASNARITAVIQPGGSVSDNKVIQESNKQNISMVITGKRCFSH